ncbi:MULTISPECIES: RidA family protein [unclassified Streptomyces]|uniref:RidA family protein n=1 Tax=unclassified Streptomyces TaxID=2593676 RepID=UPI0036E07559
MTQPLPHTVRGDSAAERLQALGLASTPHFGEQSQVANAASELLIEVLGENGRHARTAIGVAGLPLNTPVEMQMICTAV